MPFNAAPVFGSFPAPSPLPGFPDAFPSAFETSPVDSSARIFSRSDNIASALSSPPPCPLFVALISLRGDSSEPLFDTSPISESFLSTPFLPEAVPDCPQSLSVTGLGSALLLLSISANSSFRSALRLSPGLLIPLFTSGCSGLPLISSVPRLYFRLSIAVCLSGLFSIRPFPLYPFCREISGRPGVLPALISLIRELKVNLLPYTLPPGLKLAFAFSCGLPLISAILCAITFMPLIKARGMPHIRNVAKR